MEPLRKYISDVHEKLVNKNYSDKEASGYQDIRIYFNDGEIYYNKLLLSFLEPVILEVLTGNHCENVVVIYPDTSLECFKKFELEAQHEIEDNSWFEYTEVIENTDVYSASASAQCSLCYKKIPYSKAITKAFLRKTL